MKRFYIWKLSSNLESSNVSKTKRRQRQRVVFFAESCYQYRSLFSCDCDHNFTRSILVIRCRNFVSFVRRPIPLRVPHPHSLLSLQCLSLDLLSRKDLSVCQDLKKRASQPPFVFLQSVECSFDLSAAHPRFVVSDEWTPSLLPPRPRASSICSSKCFFCKSVVVGDCVDFDHPSAAGVLSLIPLLFFSIPALWRAHHVFATCVLLWGLHDGHFVLLFPQLLKYWFHSYCDFSIPGHFLTKWWSDISRSKVLSEGCESRNNHRHAIVVQDSVTQWIHSYPCRAKTSQETKRSLRKFSESSEKSKVISTNNFLEFDRACDELSWNHCTSSSHRSENNVVAEREVHRIKEATSAVLW